MDLDNPESNSLEESLRSAKAALMGADDFIVENINTTKWRVDGQEASSFIYSTDKYDIPADGVEVLNTRQNDREYLMIFITPALGFDSPEIQELEKRIINSIKFFK